MGHRAALVLALLYALGGNVPAATSMKGGEASLLQDEVSLLQMSSAAPELSRQRAQPLAPSRNLSSSASLEQKRSKLQRKISRARASLMMMEAELAELDEHSYEANPKSGDITFLFSDAAASKIAKASARRNSAASESPVSKASDEAEPRSAAAAPGATTPAARQDMHSRTAGSDHDSRQSMAAPAKQWRWEARLHTKPPSLMQLSAKTAVRSRSGNGDNGLWIGTVLYQGGVTQAFAEGEGCLTIPGVASIGGPSGLPDYLAYFANKIATEGAGMSISDQISKVSQAFTDLLPDAGNFHTVKIDLTMAGRQCMVQDRLNFSPASKMCHIGLVWAGDSAREFWITSYGGDGSELKNQNNNGNNMMMNMNPMSQMSQMNPMNQMGQTNPMNQMGQMNSMGQNQMAPPWKPPVR